MKPSYSNTPRSPKPACLAPMPVSSSECGITIPLERSTTEAPMTGFSEGVHAVGASGPSVSHASHAAQS